MFGKTLVHEFPNSKKPYWLVFVFFMEQDDPCLGQRFAFQKLTIIIIIRIIIISLHTIFSCTVHSISFLIVNIYWYQQYYNNSMLVQHSILFSDLWCVRDGRVQVFLPWTCGCLLCCNHHMQNSVQVKYIYIYNYPYV